jgi:TM2 domain-containing membrane protein YozV
MMPFAHPPNAKITPPARAVRNKCNQVPSHHRAQRHSDSSKRPTGHRARDQEWSIQMSYETANAHPQEIPSIPRIKTAEPETAPALEPRADARDADAADKAHASHESAHPAQLNVVPKNPAVALIVSVFLPGVGSMISDQPAVGTVILVSYVLGWVLTLFIVGFVIVPAAWVFGLVHAYQSAQRWNRDHGFTS